MRGQRRQHVRCRAAREQRIHRLFARPALANVLPLFGALFGRPGHVLQREVLDGRLGEGEDLGRAISVGQEDVLNEQILDDGRAGLVGRARRWLRAEAGAVILGETEEVDGVIPSDVDPGDVAPESAPPAPRLEVNAPDRSAPPLKLRTILRPARAIPAVEIARSDHG